MLDSRKKGVAVLGSTGSVGRQCLEVLALHRARFEVTVLTCQRNLPLLVAQALQFRPQAVVVGHEIYEQAKKELSRHGNGISVYAGEEGLCEVVKHEKTDVVLMALVGFSGLKPTLSAIRAKKDIALANKEVLVVAGDMIKRMLAAHGTRLHPVDSEHAAIFQCLLGEKTPPQKLILTASGGAFRGKKREELTHVRKEEALAHPVWRMGEKISIDSATMMNKGLEVIEARWLFGVDAQQIEVLVHPESIVHSMVSFCDGSLKAQLSQPDMKIPILHALSFPERLPIPSVPYPFAQRTTLHFEPPDTANFPCLSLAYQALALGGNMPCVLNAANEVAVAGFLQEKIGFMDIPAVIEHCMEKMPYIPSLNLESCTHTDEEARIRAQEFSKRL